jgi:hypothetical protein
VEDSGFAAGMLQKGLLVHGCAIRPGPLRIWNDAREAEGQSVRGGMLSGTSLCLTLRADAIKCSRQFILGDFLVAVDKKVTRLSYAVAGETPLILLFQKPSAPAFCRHQQE